MLTLLVVAPLLLAMQKPVIGGGGGGGGGFHGGKIAPTAEGKPTGPIGSQPRPGSDLRGPAGASAPSAAGAGAAPPPTRPDVVYATGGMDLTAITGGEEVEDW